MNMNDVLKGRKKARKRVGRGPGTGHGKTSGKGHGGQKSRSGASIHGLFEGGQMPLFRRVPKRGFSNARFTKSYVAVNLYRLSIFNDGDTVSEESLKEKGVISGNDTKVKILGKGEVTAKLKIDVAAVSKTAREKIEAQGGEIVEKTVKKAE
jgi:large subunit ribosomal protein L15